MANAIQNSFLFHFLFVFGLFRRCRFPFRFLQFVAMNFNFDICLNIISAVGWAADKSIRKMNVKERERDRNKKIEFTDIDRRSYITPKYY